MRLLLDTHAFLWWCADDPRLTETVLQTVVAADSEVFVSAVTGWEIAIKTRLGKLPLGEAPDAFITRMLARHAFGVLPISLRHTLRDYSLPPHRLRQLILGGAASSHEDAL